MSRNPDTDPHAVVDDNRGARPHVYLAQLRNGKHRGGCDGCGWVGNELSEIAAIDEYVAHECHVTDPRGEWRR